MVVVVKKQDACGGVAWRDVTGTRLELKIIFLPSEHGSASNHDHHIRCTIEI
jgi:hypothetical protein